MKDEILQILSQVFGINSLYSYQNKALPYILEDNNLVVSAPTASGKTLVGYMSIIKSLLQKRKAIYLTPLKALAEEKYRDLKNLEKLGFKVSISTGDYDRVDRELYKSDVIICTYEKFDSLIRHDKNWLELGGTLVADEVHMIGDPERGPTLEVALTKVLLSGEYQIVGLSATMPNGEEIAKWLNAEYIYTEWRPVQLYKGIYYSGAIFLYDGSELMDRIEIEKKDVGGLIEYFLENRGQALIFVNSRSRAESFANKITHITSKYVNIEAVMRGLSEISKNIGREGMTELESKVYDLVKYGVSFHHAGLSLAARSTIEEAFLKNYIKVIVATPTLAAGCNLPARLSLVLDSYRYTKYGRDLIPRREIEQMLGRAGRPQYDKYGYGVIHARSAKEFEDVYEKYFLKPIEPVYSNLANERSLRMHILAFIAEYPKTGEDIIKIIEKTFYGMSFGTQAIRRAINRILTYLEVNDAIKMEERKFTTTKFGKRVSELYIDPATAIEFRKFLFDYEKKDSMHPVAVFYIVSKSPDMGIYLKPSRRHEVLIGDFLVKNEGVVPVDEDIIYEDEDVIRALYAALILYDWINEMPENLIYEKWRVGIGDLRTLVSNAEWLTYSLSEIARLIGSRHYRPIRDIVERVKYGVKEELLELTRIKNVGRKRARTLYRYGIKSIDDILKIGPEGLKRFPGIGEELAKSIYEESLKLRIKYFGRET